MLIFYTLTGCFLEETVPARSLTPLSPYDSVKQEESTNSEAEHIGDNTPMSIPYIKLQECIRGKYFSS